jgi:hypothetical protein
LLPALPFKTHRQYDIYCGNKWGPSFCGSDESELVAYYEPFNGDNNCTSNACKPDFDIPVDGAGLNLLTNNEDGDFSISELEVWEVKGYVNEGKLVFYDPVEL